MSDPRPAPYPADTRAKGWRFEIDYEKVDQSDTWSLASEVPMAQPALLMMWLAAWTQEPCGSLPNDLQVIRTKCKVPAKLWPSLAGVLMRGWWLADDGRLYHDTITTRVLEMLDYRSKNAKRVADFKARLREQQAGNALPPREQPSKNDTGTGTGTGTKEEKEQKTKPRAVALLCPPDIPLGVYADWAAIRKAKKAPITATALAGFRREAEAAGFTAAAAMAICCERGWAAFKAEWVQGDGGRGGTVANRPGPGPLPNRQEAQEERNRIAMAKWLEQEGQPQ